MNINRLLEITNDLEQCAFCPDEDCTDICARCDKVKPITAAELRRYFQQVRETLSEHDALKAENAKLRSKLKTMQEEYFETCFGECESCRFYVEPDADDSNTPTEGYCSIRAELKEE